MRKALAALALIASPLALATDLGGDGLGGPSLQPRAQSAQLGEPGIANREISQVDPVLIEAGEPALDFRFAKNKNLIESTTNKSSLITFSRSAAQSPGTYVGADGLIHDAAVNLALYSERFDSWATNGGITVSANQIASPDRKQTADKIIPPASTSTAFFIKINAASTGGKSFSVFAKQGGKSKMMIYSGVANSNVYFDLSNQTVGTTLSDVDSAGVEPAANGWFRYYVNWKTDATTLRIYAIDTDGSLSVTGDGVSGVYLWGAQLEETDPATMAPTAYIKTTSQALAAPRFDHDPVTGESLGLLVEEARANLAFPSEGYSGWTKNIAGDVLTASAGTAPTGENSGASLVPDTSSAAHVLYRGFSATIGATYTVSYFVKPFGAYTKALVRIGGAGTVAAVFDLNSQSVDDSRGSPTNTFVEDYGSGWYRVGFTFSAGATTVYPNLGAVGDGYSFNGSYEAIFTGDGTSGAYIFGAQLETGSFPTSYIPTVTSQTRYADIAAVQGTDFSSFYDATEGTVFAVASSVATGTRGIVGIDDNTANERIELQTDGTDPEFVVIDGGAGSTLDTGTITAYTFFNLTGAYKHNDLAATVGGVAVQTATDTLPTVDRMRIGVLQASGTYLNGHIKRLTYWPRRQADPTLQVITQ